MPLPKIQSSRARKRPIMMHEIRRQFLLTAMKVFDLVMVTLCFGLSTILFVDMYQKISVADFFAMRVKISNYVLFALLLVFCHMIFRFTGLYKSKRLATRRELVVDVFTAVTICAAAIWVFGRVFSIRMITSEFTAIFWATSLVLILASRIALRFTLSRVRLHGKNLRYMLILGTNARAIEFAKKCMADPMLGYRILGFVDDEWEGTKEFLRLGYKKACDYASLPEFLRNNVVDEVAMYLPLRSYHQQSTEVASLCQHHGILFRLDTDIFNLKKLRSRADSIGGKQHIATYRPRPEGWPMVAKRTLDLVGSGVLLVLLSPLLAVVALLIRRSSNGPVFFLQERVGYNKRTFKIYKFRTMVPDAEKLQAELEDQNEAGGPVFKIKDDPRITPIGKFLRRSSIDELPQLINVFKGDMSLVGPRPLPVRDYQGFNEDWQRRRFSVRPGITCLWQVTGRSSITFDQWMRLDLQYLDEWSFWLDLKILARTVPAVLKGSGAV